MPVLRPVPRAATAAEFAAHVRERTPAVYHVEGSSEAEWRSQLERHGAGRSFPVRFPTRAAATSAPYLSFVAYCWASFKANFWRRRMTLAEAASAGAKRWMVSGIDQRVEAGGAVELAPLAALDALMPAEARTTATGCWISSAGCATGLHWDSFGPHNFHLQVCGSKHFVLFDSSQAAALYCYGGLRYLLRFAAAVDFERPDLGRFPRYASAQGLEVVLEAGDVLFIPAFHWHACSHLGELNGSYTRWFEEPPATHPREPPVPWAVHLNLLRFFVRDPLLDLVSLIASLPARLARLLLAAFGSERALRLREKAT